MRRYAGTAVSVAILAAVAFAPDDANAAKCTGNPIKIPVATSFEGPYASYSINIYNTATLLAVDKVNDEGGIHGRCLEVYKVAVPYPETLSFVTEFRRIAADPNVLALLGPDYTNAHYQIMEIIEKEKIPVFNPGSGGIWKLPDFGKWSFRYQPMADEVFPKMLPQVVKKHNVKSAAMIYSLDEAATKDQIAAAQKTLEAAGVKIATTQTYKNKETNFGPQVASIKAANPDIVMASFALAADGGTFVKQLRERGVNAQIVTDLLVNELSFWEVSQGAAEGSILYGLWTPNDPRPIVQNFISTWRKRANDANGVPDNYMAAWYDAVLVFAEVMRAAPQPLTREGIRDAFSKVKVETLSGTVRWDGPGDVKREKPYVVMWSKGKIVPWQ